MRVEQITDRPDLVVRRLVLEPGEATIWHTDACHRFTVVVRGDRLTIEFDEPDADPIDVEVHPGLAEWDEPSESVHRAVNTGAETYEEVVTFYRSGPDVEPQPARSDLRR